MTSAQYGLVGGVNPNRAVGYTLDLVGNRNQTTDTTATTQSYTPNNLNQYTGNVGTSAITNGSEHRSRTIRVSPTNTQGKNRGQSHISILSEVNANKLRF